MRQGPDRLVRGEDVLMPSRVLASDVSYFEAPQQLSCLYKPKLGQDSFPFPEREISADDHLSASPLLDRQLTVLSV